MTTELLAWHSVSDTMPDDDITVLLWVEHENDNPQWITGFKDGDKFFEGCFPVVGTVTHWAEPNGPHYSPTP